MSSPPGYIRLFACTDESILGTVALAYTRSLLRIAPVRLVSMSPGGLAGRWRALASLLATPMTGSYVNVVMCDPGRWTWLHQVSMPSQNVTPAELAAAQAAPIGSDARDPFCAIECGEVAKDRLELYTPSVRNVLFAVVIPRGMDQIETARKYDAVVLGNGLHFEWWGKNVSATALAARVIAPSDPIDHRAVRDVIVPPS